MKPKRIIALTIALLITISCCLTACKKKESEPVTLDKPTNLSVVKDQLSWDAVAKASGYKVKTQSVWDAEKVVESATIQGTSFSLAGVTENSTVRVKAIGSGNFIDSEWSEATFYDAESSGGELEDDEEEDTFDNYYAKLSLAKDRKIYVLGNGYEGRDEIDTTETWNDFKDDHYVIASVIQGLFNRVEVSFYLNALTVTNGVNVDIANLDYHKQKYGLTTENISLEEAVELYKEAWEVNAAVGGKWYSRIALSTLISTTGVSAVVPGANLKTPGYVLYDPGRHSLNVAINIASVFGLLPIPVTPNGEYETWAQSLGLEKKVDVTRIIFDYNFCYQRLRNELSRKALINQNFVLGESKSNPFLKDYAVANKYFTLFYNNTVDVPESHRNQIQGWLEKNTPVFGYPEHEVNDVNMFAGYGQFIVPTDFSHNLSFFAATKFRRETDGTLTKYNPNVNAEENVAAVAGKHYVSFIVSDGDNASMWQNTAPYAGNMMGASVRDGDDFKLTWGVTPSMVDLMPGAYEMMLKQQAHTNDSFIVPVSGQGYANLAGLKKTNPTYYNSYIGSMSDYLKKSGLDIVTVMSDASTTAERIGTYQDLANVPELKGGLIYEGDKYCLAQGVTGGIYWADGVDADGNPTKKPFIAPRDTLWSTTPAYIAARILQYPKDITSINGYTIINVHPWSHTYQDIRKICDMLASDSNIEVVSMNRLYQMVIDNVTDKTNPASGYRLPTQSGYTITESALRSNPEAVPVDKYQNEFALWAEDWTGGIHTSSDTSTTGESGASFKNALKINVGSSAEKAAYTLPSDDNVHIWFNARCDSTNASTWSEMKVELTVAGVTKVVMDGVKLRGVENTGLNSSASNSVTGDGWQYFAFPISQYFSDYKGKTASVKVTNKATSSAAIKIDMFTTEPINTSQNASFDPLNNQFENKNTEDWAFGHRYMTSSYYFWGAYKKDTLKASGSIMVDCSNGGGALKRNGNSNMFMIKTYTLPNTNSIELKFKPSHDKDDEGAKCKISILIDGQYVVLYDWQRPGTSTNVTIDLTSIMSAVGITDLAGKTATVVFEARDSGDPKRDGAGELVELSNFITIAK